MNKVAAHFLNTANLHDSPPNDAIKRAYAENNIDLDYFAPDFDQGATIKHANYGFRWILANFFKRDWKRYTAFSSTSENPVVIAAILAIVWRKPFIFLSDEIKTESYSGDRSKLWKKVCRWSMRKASITIVNDISRDKLQRDYAGLSHKNNVVVYPGCFLKPPKAEIKFSLREKWSMQDNDLVLGFSGGCNLSGGIDWALNALDDHLEMKMIAQPLSLDPLNLYLLRNHRNVDRIYLEKNRLSWQESWSSMGGVDIGIAIYLNQASQFQLMGISSNRLCMFLAMGVPVIVSRQASFNFIEEYNCGIQVENAREFSQAITTISSDLDNMKKNALKCAREYIDTDGRYQTLLSNMTEILN